MRKIIQTAISLTFVAAACGDGRGVPASCGRAVSCGGSIVGDWSLAGSCVNAAAYADFYMVEFQTSCPPTVSVTNDVTLAYVPTTVSFAADGTYAGTFVLNGSIGIRIPTACLAGTCLDLDAQVRAWVAPGSDVAAASCQDMATSCSCSITRGRVSSQTGTYTANGFSLMTRPSQGPGTLADYCVAEPELHLVTRIPSSLALDATLIFASDTVLVRQ